MNPTFSLPNPAVVVWDDWLRLGIEALTLVFLIVYVVKTWQMASATRRAAEATRESVAEAVEARMEALAPRVLVYLNPVEMSFVEVVVHNAGAGTAQNVTFVIDPPLQGQDGEDPGRFFATAKAAIPPGFVLHHFLGTGAALLREGPPKRYEVRVAFDGAENGRHYECVQILDLADHMHREEIARKTLHDVAESLERGFRNIDQRLDRLIKLDEIESARSQYRGNPERKLVNAVASISARWRLFTEDVWTAKSEVWWQPAIHELRADAMALLTAAAAQPEGAALVEQARELVGLLFERGKIGDKDWGSRVSACVRALNSEIDSRRDP